eukprot:1390977-Rhodomonas_salina.2
MTGVQVRDTLIASASPAAAVDSDPGRWCHGPGDSDGCCQCASASGRRRGCGWGPVAGPSALENLNAGHLAWGTGPGATEQDWSWSGLARWSLLLVCVSQAGLRAGSESGHGYSGTRVPGYLGIRVRPGM